LNILPGLAFLLRVGVGGTLLYIYDTFEACELGEDNVQYALTVRAGAARGRRKQGWLG
jgi:hypothetical protein